MDFCLLLGKYFPTVSATALGLLLPFCTVLRQRVIVSVDNYKIEVSRAGRVGDGSESKVASHKPGDLNWIRGIH